MKEIKLTQGQVALVDDEDYDMLMQYKWCAHKQGCGDFYAVRTIKLDGKNYTIRMHRFLMGLTKGEKLVVHHKNHNTLDNRKINLINCTHKENLRHQKPQKRITSSIFKGVTWDKTKNKWMSKLQHNGFCRFLGYFTDEKEAAKAYNEAALKHFGEFALLNEIA